MSEELEQDAGTAETAETEEDDLDRYMRERGITHAQLDQWRAERVAAARLPQPLRPIHHLIEPHRFHLRSGRYCYYLHPWALLKDVSNEVSAILHRGLYGWDRSDIWGMDSYLAHILPQMLRHLKDHHNGVGWPFLEEDEFDQPRTPDLMAHLTRTPDETPLEAADRRYCAWLEAKADAFDQYRALMEDFVRDDDPRWQEVHDQMADLMRHLPVLWD